MCLRSLTHILKCMKTSVMNGGVIRRPQHDAAVCNVMSGVITVCLWDQIRWISCSRTSMFILLSGMTYISWRRVKLAVLIDSLAWMQCCREEATAQCSPVCLWWGELQVIWGESARLHLDPRDNFTWLGRITFLLTAGGNPPPASPTSSPWLCNTSVLQCALFTSAVSLLLSLF